MALIYIEYLFFGSDLQQRTAYINETKTLEKWHQTNLEACCGWGQTSLEAAVIEVLLASYVYNNR